jgi:hypothetical protein
LPQQRLDAGLWRLASGDVTSAELFQEKDREVIAKVPLSELDREIKPCLYGYENRGTYCES